MYLYFDEINDCIKVHLGTLLMLSTVYLPCKTISVDAVVCICKIFDYMLNCNVLCFSVFQNIALQQLCSVFAKGGPGGCMEGVGHWLKCKN